MNDSQTLLVVLVVIYLVECVFWVRPGGLIFRSFWNCRWNLTVPTDFLTNHRGRLCWSNPLPPFGSVHVTRTFPFCLSPQGLRMGSIEHADVTAAPEMLPGQFLSFAAMDTIEAREKKLFVNQQLIWRSDSVHQPAAFAKLLRELKESDPEERATRIKKELSTRFDIEAIAAARARFAKETQSLQRLAVGLFVLLFGICPAAVRMAGWQLSLIPLLVAIFALTVTITVVFRRRHKSFYPHADEDRFRLCMLTALVPAVSIRARELLGRSLLEPFHPLAVSKVLLESAVFQRFARLCWRELKYPFIRRVEMDSASADTEAWFRCELLVVHETFLRRVGIPDRIWLQAPRRSDPSHTLYCPRCESQFTDAGTECAACGGHALDRMDELKP